MSAVRRVARGRVRRTSRNSADRWAIASQPAKAKNSTTVARPMPPTPCGANVPRFSARSCGSATRMTTTRIAATPIASATCTFAPNRSPARFAVTAAASTSAAKAGAQRWPSPREAAT